MEAVEPTAVSADMADMFAPVNAESPAVFGA